MENLFQLSLENFDGALLAGIPALLNLGILVYALFFLPRSRTTSIFTFFVIALFFFQTNDTFMRLSVTEETAKHWDGIFSLGWLFVAPLGLHFACLYSGIKRINNSRWALTAIYFPFILFETFYRTNIPDHHFVYYDFWGWVNQPHPGTFEEIQRYWISDLVLIAVLVFFIHAYSMRKDEQKKNQSLLIAIGFLIPTVQGIITQVIFPLVIAHEEIPVTSTFMTCFSLATLIALKKYKLFSVSESVSVDTVLESLTDIVFIVSPDKKIIYMNPFASRIFKNPGDEEAGHVLEKIFPSGTEDYSRFSAIILQQSLKGTSMKNFDSVFATGNGSQIQVLVSSELVTNNKLLQGVLFVARDVTSQKSSELLLRKSQSQLLAAQQIAHIGSWEWDLLSNKVIWSDELYRIFGLEPAKTEATSKLFLEIIHPEDLAQVKEVLNESFSNQKPIKLSHRIIRPDGKIRFLEGRAELVSNEDGNPKKLIGTEQDVTEKKLEEGLERIAFAASKSYNAVIIADRNGKIEWVNEGFNKYTGYSLEEVIGTGAEVLRRGERTGLTERPELFSSLIRDKKPVLYESKNYSKEGREYWALSSITPVLNEMGEVEKIICIDSDITKLKNIEDELRNEKRLTEELMKTKEQFLANMSHEIRTPMNAILGLTDVLLKGNLGREETNYLTAIKNSGSSLMVIINDILDISKIASGKMILEVVTFNLFETVHSIMDMFVSKEKEKPVKFEIIFGQGVPEWVDGDSVRFSEILINLMSNACKFTAQGSITFHAELTNQDENFYHLSFSVSDTGIGIPEDKLNMIFESFTQASTDITRKFGGTGLGLSIVKGLVELHGGKVSVQSNVGSGSTFTFSIRMAKNNSGNSSVEPVLTHSYPSDLLHNKTILIVEDNETNLVLAQKVLGDMGCITHTASDGEQAILKLKATMFDLILMDIKMPVMDGYETTLYIRSKMKSPQKDIPIIALTAHAALLESNKCIDAGMNDYLSKPFTSELLFYKIARLLSPAKQAVSGTLVNELTDPHSSGKNKDTALVNLSYLRDVSKGSNEFMVKMINTFIAAFPGNCLLLQKHLDEKDYDSLYSLAHKMKPSISFMGISVLEKVIRNLEDAAREKRTDSPLAAWISEITQTGFKAIDQLKKETQTLKSSFN